MEWYVYYEDVNKKKIEKFNIFNHAWFTDDCIKILEKYTGKRKLSEDEISKPNPDVLNDIAEDIKHSLMYYYWTKCEWEVLLVSWTSPENKKTYKKIDVYEQVMMNYPAFIEYVWYHQNELKTMKRK